MIDAWKQSNGEYLVLGEANVATILDCYSKNERNYVQHEWFFLQPEPSMVELVRRLTAFGVSICFHPETPGKTIELDGLPQKADGGM